MQLSHILISYKVHRRKNMKFKLLGLFMMLFLVTGCGKSVDFIESFEKKLSKEKYEYIVLDDYNLIKDAKSGKKYIFNDGAPVSVIYFGEDSNEYKNILKDGCINVRGSITTERYLKECGVLHNKGYVLHSSGNNENSEKIKEIFESIK